MSAVEKRKMTFARGRNAGNFRYSVMMPSKGLQNNPGENNCFLNSAVQVLWHLDVFRRSFRLLEGHACLQGCCIFCALKDIFEKFQTNNDDALRPDVLRIALAKAFQDQRKFQIGRMDDAAECFENILRRLHFHIAYKEPEDMCNAKHCIPHQKFAMQILEQTFCKCGATSEPFNFFQIVNYVSASALIFKASQCTKDGHRPYRSFGELLRATLSFGEKRPCPDDKRCMYKERNIPPTRMHRTLLNSPDIVGIGIVWDTDRPSADYIADVLDCLGKKLEVKEIFDNASEEKARNMKLRLVGMMTYYGKHYTTFFYNTRQRSWFYFDDAKVKEIGDDWELVKAKCQRDRSQPLLVLYANPEGDPISHVKPSKTIEVINEEELQKLSHIHTDDDCEEAYEGLGPRPVKRKSFKKMMGSAFKKTKRKQKKYNVNHVDMVLGVNGHHIRDTSESEAEPAINDSFHDFSDHERVANSKKSPTKDTSSAPSTPSRSSKYHHHSNKSIPDAGKIQTDLLAKHKRHLSSLESNSDRRSEASDYDNLESPRSADNSRNRISLSDSNGSVFSSKDNMADSKGSNRSSPIRKSSKDNSPSRKGRGSLDVAESFDRAISSAESILESSFAAEKAGDVIEAFHLCTEANRHYRSAIDIIGLPDSMKQFADNKRWETHDRSRFLNDLIDRKRWRVSKSADFVRGVSKTSDYGSLSDASSSPITPSISENGKGGLFPTSSEIDFQRTQVLEQPKKTSMPDCKKSNGLPSGHELRVGKMESAEYLPSERVKGRGKVDKHPSASEMEQLTALLEDIGVREGVSPIPQDDVKNDFVKLDCAPKKISTATANGHHSSFSSDDLAERGSELNSRQNLAATKMPHSENSNPNSKDRSTEITEATSKVNLRNQSSGRTIKSENPTRRYSDVRGYKQITKARKEDCTDVIDPISVKENNRNHNSAFHEVEHSNDITKREVIVNRADSIRSIPNRHERDVEKLTIGEGISNVNKSVTRRPNIRQHSFDTHDPKQDITARNGGTSTIVSPGDIGIETEQRNGYISRSEQEIKQEVSGRILKPDYAGKNSRQPQAGTVEVVAMAAARKGNAATSNIETTKESSTDGVNSPNNARPVIKQYQADSFKAKQELSARRHSLKVINPENFRANIQKYEKDFPQTKLGVTARCESLGPNDKPSACDTHKDADKGQNQYENLGKPGLKKQFDEANHNTNNVKVTSKDIQNIDRHEPKITKVVCKKQDDLNSAYRQQLRAAGSKFVNLPGKLFSSQPGLSRTDNAMSNISRGSDVTSGVPRGNKVVEVSQRYVRRNDSIDSRPIDRRRRSLSNTFLGKDVDERSFKKPAEEPEKPVRPSPVQNLGDSKNNMASQPINSSHTASTDEITQSKKLQRDAKVSDEASSKLSRTYERSSSIKNEQEKSRVAIVKTKIINDIDTPLSPSSEPYPAQGYNDVSSRYHSSQQYQNLSSRSDSAQGYQSAIDKPHSAQGHKEVPASSNSQEVQLKLPVPPTSRGSVRNRWPMDVDFSNSPRQMCEQCGTVTVEKPKKFCSSCQSDYL